LADLVPGLAGGAARGVVVRSQLGEPGGGVADEDPGDLADDPGDRDDGLLLAALAGDPAVLGAEAGIGARRGHRGLAERAAQVPVALAGTARPGGFPGLPAARGQPGPGGSVPGGGELGGVRAELGDDDLGVALPDPGDLIQPLSQPQDGSLLPGAARSVIAAGQPAGSAGRCGPGDGRQRNLALSLRRAQALVGKPSAGRWGSASSASNCVALQDRPVKGSFAVANAMAQAPPLTVPPFQAVSGSYRMRHLYAADPA